MGTEEQLQESTTFQRRREKKRNYRTALKDGDSE